jgi:transposase-like protein
VNTEGFACPNRTCPYSGITDAHIHALVGDGTHGHAERIQTFRCQACRTTFTARRHTPFYRLKTPSQQIGVVLTARACGLDPSAAERIFGYRQATITTWLSRGFRACADLARALASRNLQLPHLQLDELRTMYGLRTSWLFQAFDDERAETGQGSVREWQIPDTLAALMGLIRAGRGAGVPASEASSFRSQRPPAEPV